MEVRGDPDYFCYMDGYKLLQLLKDQLKVPKHLINIAGVHKGCIEITILLPQKWKNIDVRKKLKDITTSAVIPDWIDQDRFKILGIRLPEDTEYTMFTSESGEKSECKY